MNAAGLVKATNELLAASAPLGEYLRLCACGLVPLASNLGQIVGRARYGVLAPRPQPALVVAEEAARLRRDIERRQAAEITEREAAARRADNDATRRTARRAPAAAIPQRAKPAQRRERWGKMADLERLLRQHPQGLSLPALRATLGWATDDVVKRLRLLPIEKSGRRRSFIYRLKTGSGA